MLGARFKNSISININIALTALEDPKDQDLVLSILRSLSVSTENKKGQNNQSNQHLPQITTIYNSE